MMSHWMASFKLTPWHEGTFASSVIYLPPQLPPPPIPFLFSCLSPSISSLPLSLLPQNDIHYFIVKQESFFSCSPGTKREKIKDRKAKSLLGQVLWYQLELYSLWPGGPCCWKWQSVAQWRQECDRLSGEIQLHVWGRACWVRDCLFESARILTSTAGIMLQLTHRYVRITCRVCDYD